MKKIRNPLLIFLGLLISAVLVRYWVAPQVTRMPTDYAAEMDLININGYRESPGDLWETHDMIARRTDQVLSTLNDALIIQGALSVYNKDGSVNFETSALYGVDRRSRMNVSDLGDTQRSGQFLFPPRIQKSTYVYWDPVYIGPRTAIFDRIEEIDGLGVYVFNFSAENFDESDGFSYLPLVPEKYRAITNGQGILWIEPVSGIVVNYEDQGSSSYVDISTGSAVADFSRWDERYSPETIANQLSKARAARGWILLLENWLPAALILAGFIWL
jgi:hypothetical protein